MKIAIFGGSFDPVHIGHLFIAGEIRDHFGFDKIIFIPANTPVHKEHEKLLTPRHRLKMLRLAVAPHPPFLVDPRELKRGGNSYTIDTVREIQDLYERNDKPGLIIGDDLAETFDTWKEAALLADMVNLIVAHRLSRERLKIDFPCTYIDNSLLPVSSSEIRDRIARGKSVQYLLPRRVFRYIKRHGLYSGD